MMMREMHKNANWIGAYRRDMRRVGPPEEFREKMPKFAIMSGSSLGLGEIMNRFAKSV